MKRIPIVILLLAAGLSVRAEQVLSLEEAVRLAERRQVQVIMADRRVDQAIARLGESRSPLLPQLSATGSQVRKTINLEALGFPIPGNPLIGPFNSFDARVKLTQTIFDAGALERLRQARAGRELSIAQQQKARQDATALVATLYIEARRAEGLRIFAKAIVARDEENLQLAQQRLKTGTGTAVELSQAEAQRASSRHQLGAAESDALEKRMDLQASLGIPSDQTVIFVPEESLPVPEPLSDTDVRRLAGQHDSVEIARANLLVRQKDLSAAKADYYPRLSASADYGASGTTPDNSFGTYSYGGQLSLPLYEGGQKQSKAKETKKALEESEAQLADTRLQAEARALSANQALQKSWTLVEAAQTQLAATRLELDLARVRYRTGTGSRFELTQRQTLLAQAVDQLEDAAAGYQMARITWARSLSRMDSLFERK